MFKELDKDKSGTVHPDELEDALKAMRIPRKYRKPKVTTSRRTLMNPNLIQTVSLRTPAYYR